jgi:hypothetical protein
VRQCFAAPNLTCRDFCINNRRPAPTRTWHGLATPVAVGRWHLARAATPPGAQIKRSPHDQTASSAETPPPAADTGLHAW